mgnify:CR=1 FL=1
MDCFKPAYPYLKKKKKKKKSDKEKNRTSPPTVKPPLYAEHTNSTAVNRVHDDGQESPTTITGVRNMNRSRAVASNSRHDTLINRMRVGWNVVKPSLDIMMRLLNRLINYKRFLMHPSKHFHRGESSNRNILASHYDSFTYSLNFDDHHHHHWRHGYLD